MNYIIESNLDFYAELQKQLNEPSLENTKISNVAKNIENNNNNIENNNNNNENNNNENNNNNIENIEIKNGDNVCLLTNEPLSYNNITLDCNHTFNYLPLYKEVCYQKLDNFLETTRLHINEIKCPYCRTITKKLLPYIVLSDVIQRKKGVNFPAKYCMKLHTCGWTSKNKKICGCDAYTTDSGTYCASHHKKFVLQSETLDAKQHINQVDDIEWTDAHKKLNKQYKIVDLKTMLREKKLRVGGNKKQLIDRIIKNL